jgi:hypothetical protein
MLLRIVGVMLAVSTIGVSAVNSQRRTPRRPVAAAIDYSRFSHATAKHQGACNTCHKVPTRDWRKVSQYPDITDYPGHAACVSCHRAQFFKGARPPICSVCHTKTSPRDEARFAFRNPAALLQFSIEFPHDKHQDVIALKRTQQERPAFAHAFRRANTNLQDDTYNNCSICHRQPTAALKPPAAGWPDGFVPQLATFKASPQSHAACFNCHWKEQAPVATDCNGCHKLTKPYAESEAPTRISLKFLHEGGGEKKTHIAECTTCHINITKATSLRGLKADVPITACTECHNREGLRQDVSKELLAIDKNRTFTCTYCHTSNVGQLDAPPGHYLISDRVPLKRKDIK